jgi:hypothetical protein
MLQLWRWADEAGALLRVACNVRITCVASSTGGHLQMMDNPAAASCCVCWLHCWVAVASCSRSSCARCCKAALLRYHCHSLPARRATQAASCSSLSIQGCYLRPYLYHMQLQRLEMSDQGVTVQEQFSVHVKVEVDNVHE